MPESQEEATVVMLTTTTEPYVFHIPTILSCPNGITYRFRYQNRLLDSQVVNIDESNLRSIGGVLYLRDNKSELKLCYPIRRFKILWKEDETVISFFNLEMSDIIQYECIETVRERLQDTYPDSIAISHRNLCAEYSAQEGERITLPPQSKLALPVEKEPPIFTDEELRGAIDVEKYVWLDKRSIFHWSGEASETADEENNKWSTLMPTLSLIHRLRNVCFWRISGLSRLGQPKEIFSPQLIAKSDESGLHTHGYTITADRACSLSIRQVIPKAFADESFEMNQFEVSLKDSDPYIEPLTSQEVIDGTYDRFDLSFRFLGDAVGKTCLLRIKCTQPLDIQQGKKNTGLANWESSIPPTILPIRVRLPRRYPWFRGLTFFTAFLIPFLQPILKRIYQLATPEGAQITVPPSLEIGIPVALLLLTFLFGWLGGIRLASRG